MEDAARLVCVNLLAPDDAVLHRDLPEEAIARRASSRGVLCDRRFHDGRARLLVYG
jgi:hypothetical protein